MTHDALFDGLDEDGRPLGRARATEGPEPLTDVPQSNSRPPAACSRSSGRKAFWADISRIAISKCAAVGPRVRAGTDLSARLFAYWLAPPASFCALTARFGL